MAYDWPTRLGDVINSLKMSKEDRYLLGRKDRKGSLSLITGAQKNLVDYLSGITPMKFLLVAEWENLRSRKNLLDTSGKFRVKVIIMRILLLSRKV